MQALQCGSASSSHGWQAVRRQPAPRLHHRTGCRAAASSGSDGLDEHTRRALREAAELLAAAQQLAQQQTVAELLGSWSADTAQQQVQQQTTAAPSSDAALLALLLEQGLSESQAACLLASLRAEPELAPCLAGGVLAHKLQQLGRVLPETDLGLLVLQEPRLLAADAGQLVAALVALVQGLPGRDVMAMVAQRPRLLLLGDMPARLARVIGKLVALHPSHSETVIAGIIEENPDLIFRMDFWLGDNVRLIDDLPIEIQNMMVLGDHGIGFLHRYWNNRLTEPAKKQEWDEASGEGI